ncbi:hypothetical protein MRB53_016608 [Persea americana]|uniref:Uncharacterized protein n=1 Tax=Persea americana TaxID=3435 RepID=A0ACC2M3L5_PERAE|nr:hypothetical protein MRB53_016608 [Persea americana]
MCRPHHHQQQRRAPSSLPLLPPRVELIPFTELSHVISQKSHRPLTNLFNPFRQNFLFQGSDQKSSSSSSYRTRHWSFFASRSQSLPEKGHQSLAYVAFGLLLGR